MRELGRVSEASRDLGWKEARANYGEVLSRLALSARLSTELETEILTGGAFLGGDEHLNLRINSDPDRVFKLTAYDQFGVKAFFDPNDVAGTGCHFLATGNDDPHFYLQRWELLNKVSSY